MMISEILAKLPMLSVAERDEVRQQLMELDEASADLAAEARSRELAVGGAQAETQTMVFGRARVAVEEPTRSRS